MTSHYHQTKTIRFPSSRHCPVTPFRYWNCLQLTVFVLALQIGARAAWAENSSIQYRESRVVPTSVESAQIIRVKAEQWHLSEAEYRRYLALMDGERGVWSPGLDPLTALGVSADTAHDRRRYAELFVAREYERTRKELAFQKAVDSAWMRLYPGTPRLETIDTQTLGSESKGAAVRYAVVVRKECAACDVLLEQQLAGLIESATEGVDIYVAGTAGDDAALREWLEQRPPMAAALQRGGLTVNHGAQFEGRLDLPVVYRKQGGGAWSER